MSTFTGNIIEIPQIAVDMFTDYNKYCYFLSHCHTDHTKGIQYINNTTIYTSYITRSIIINRYPNLEPYIIGLSLHDSHLIPISNDEDHCNVVLIEAGHCPGSVMFLFTTSSNNKTLLYTGDFRITLDDITSIQALHNTDDDDDDNNTIISIDKLYFDSTFWSERYYDFPSRQESAEAVSNIVREWITETPEHIVCLIMPSHYGYEGLLIDLYKTLGMLIYVSDEVYQTYGCLADLDGVFSKDKSKCRIQSYLKSDNIDKELEDDRVRIVHLSAMYWNSEKYTRKAYEKLSEKCFRVCYSSHCSFRELKDFVRYLQPREAEPCVADNDAVRESVRMFVESLRNICTRKRKCISEISDDQFNRDKQLKNPKNTGKRKSTLYSLMNCE